MRFEVLMAVNMLTFIFQIVIWTLEMLTSTSSCSITTQKVNVDG